MATNTPTTSNRAFYRARDTETGREFRVPLPPAPLDPDLRAFLTDWLAWAEAGAPESPVFDASVGLCTNAQFWWYGKPLETACVVELLEDVFAGKAWPFGPKAYGSFCIDRNEAHLDPNRVGWVRAALALDEAGDAA